MALSDKEDELIDLALQEQLTDEDRVLFDEAMKSETFKEAFERRRFMVQSLEQHVEQDLRSALQQHAAQSTPSARGIRGPWLIAAAITLVVAAGSIFWPTQSSILNSYYEPFPAAPTFRSDDNSDKGSFDAYNRGDWQLAAEELADYQGTYKSVYLGTIYFNLDGTALAESYFQEAAKSSVTLERYVGEWYLALLALKGKDMPTAKSRLNEIAKGQGPYAKEAQKMLEELRWVWF